MRIFYIIFLSLLSLFATITNANAALNIFACEPEWGSLVAEIGKNKVNIFSATTAQVDPHYIKARPSLLAKMRKSDFVICSGASLEIGWLPIILQAAGSGKVQPGNVGFLQIADIVKTIERPFTIDRKDGDVHPEGNPHLHLNPYNILLAAKEINVRLQKIDPDNASYYEANHQIFNKKWQEAIKKWENEAASLKDMAIITHHTTFAYLENWLGLKRVATLELKPGIPATSSHLEDLIALTKQNQIKLIIRTPFDPQNDSEWLNKKTGIKMLELPFTVDGNKESKDLFSLFDSTIAILKTSLNR